ncbi:Gfo/Idh/MocA family protein [Salinigranum halophilum]|uniref:Gfo/Idh/MocA family protein n=1 Tax=Salinigranum halophilum TaxID=2565931 RepID=UPI0010A929BC|nr:Gfo/Idh/MocA family oxidoreductase [Salinigranum halophilum]
MTDRIAFVGAGANPNDPDTDGYAMAYRHAAGYQRIDGCELVGCADIVRENAEVFADRHDIPPSGVYESYETMLDETDPDVVSVCVPPPVHAQIVIDCAETGVVDAIHCEKPMAQTWQECREMVDVCQQREVQLTFNHQRRFARPFQRAKELSDEGYIGDLQRVEIGGKNLYDYGTHLFDFCTEIVDGAAAEWVLAQIDYREENVQFGVHNENGALVQWEYENGVSGFASTGDSSLLDCQLRLVGLTGVIEVGVESGPSLRAKRDTDDEWQTLDTEGDEIHFPTGGLVGMALQKLDDILPERVDVPGTPVPYTSRAIENAVDCYRTGTDSPLRGEVALQGTELIFAAYESARKRGRVDLPLDVDDNPLESMVEARLVEVEASAD